MLWDMKQPSVETNNVNKILILSAIVPVWKHAKYEMMLI